MHNGIPHVEERDWYTIEADRFGKLGIDAEVVIPRLYDMGYDENICELGKNADIVVIECSFPDKKSLDGKHLEPELIGNLAKIGNFKSVILTHLSPKVNGKEKTIIDTIQNIADCKVSIAHDLKIINF